MDKFDGLISKLYESYAIMDNKYKLDYDIFSVHEHNSLEHHLAVMIAWFLISWPILLLAWISCRIVGGEEFR